jgi:hypothetical protein
MMPRRQGSDVRSATIEASASDPGNTRILSGLPVRLCAENLNSLRCLQQDHLEILNAKCSQAALAIAAGSTS